MSELNELYQQVILDHTKNPRNKRRMDNATSKAEGYNPLCGDRVTIYAVTEGDIIKELSFEGSGCAISTASVSMLTDFLKGKNLKEAKLIFENFHGLVTGKETSEDDEGKLGKLIIFKGVREFPTRVKCATLSWHTLIAALENKQAPVSTE